MLADYYIRILYPLQDKVIPAFSDSPFYLTGGTALSRGYYHHRYSDDLDYFVNDLSDFERIVDRQIEKLRKKFKEIEIGLKEKHFCRIFVSPEKLKIEMIDDVPSHIGTLVKHPVLGLMDSKENILANKLTALIDRALPKDIVDLYFLLKDSLDIKKGLLDAESKAAGISPLIIAKIFSEFDYSILSSEIKWITPVEIGEIHSFLDTVSKRIVRGS